MEQRLQDALCWMLQEEPWYAHAAMNMVWMSSSHIDTMGVRVRSSGDVECVYSPKCLAELTLAEIATVIQHEIEHVVRQHCQRLSGRDHEQWNIAADMVVNGPRHWPRIGIRDAHTGRPAIPYAEELFWLPNQWPDSLSTEECYRRVQNSTQQHNGVLLDDHGIWEESDATGMAMAEVVDAFVDASTKASQGSLPAGLQVTLDALRTSQVSWSRMLNHYLKGVLTKKSRQSYRLRNRRRDEFGIPGRMRSPQPRLNVIVDTSGSVSKNELEHFFSEIERLCRLTRVDVLLWDSAFQGYFCKYQPGDWQSLPIAGRGGTDMAAPLLWLVKNNSLGDCVITLTDGHCDWPDPHAIPYLAVITSPACSGPAWGKSIYLSLS